MSKAKLARVLRDVRACEICNEFLPLSPKPILAVGHDTRILIIGQAPGKKVHDSGVPWQDASGNNLRNWMGIEDNTFYDANQIAIVPMGFCYPGKGKSGDLPPRPECAPQWHETLLNMMPDIQLTLLIGQYAQKYYLKENAERNLTETVRKFEQFLPAIFPLPHPSPRNNIWQRKNPWFQQDLLPELKRIVKKTLSK